MALILGSPFGFPLSVFQEPSAEVEEVEEVAEPSLKVTRKVILETLARLL